MFGLESLSGSLYAGSLVGLVFAEAITLYVGYGALTRHFGPRFLSALGGE